VLVAYLVLLNVVNAAELELDTKLELGIDKTLLLIDDEAIRFELRLGEVVLLVDVGTVEVVEVPLVSEVLVLELVVEIVVLVGASVLVVGVVLLVEVLVVLVAVELLVLVVLVVEVLVEVVEFVVVVEELELVLFVVDVVLVVRVVPVVLVVEVLLVDVGAIELEVVIPCTKQPPVTEGTALTPVEIGIMFAVTDPVHVAA
jgi:hypothetical protein